MDILIAGVGGQGTLLASRVLGNYAANKNLDCKLSEVHGMAQRGGSVVTFVRIGSQISSPVIDVKNADIIIAFEKLEALRYLHYLKEDGRMLYSSQEIMPMPVVSGREKYPHDIEERLINAVKIDAMSLAKQAGNIKTANSVMIGALTKIMNLSKEDMLQAIKDSIPSKMLEINIKAFELGYNA